MQRPYIFLYFTAIHLTIITYKALKLRSLAPLVQKIIM